MLEIVYALIGMILYSFFNVVGIRILKDEDFIYSRSYCPNCKHTLSMLDMIPVLSYILLKGRCRYCGKKVSIIYPLVELLGGIVFYIYASFCEVNELNSLIIIVLSLLAFIDYYTMKIPDLVIIVLYIIGFIQLYYIYDIIYVIGMLIIPLPIFIFNKLYKELMGVGDLLVYGALGLIFGLNKIIYIFMYSLWIGAIVGIILRKKGNEPFPFIPCIALATLLTMI